MLCIFNHSSNFATQYRHITIAMYIGYALKLLFHRRHTKMTFKHAAWNTSSSTNICEEVKETGIKFCSQHAESTGFFKEHATEINNHKLQSWVCQNLFAPKWLLYSEMAASPAENKCFLIRKRSGFYCITATRTYPVLTTPPFLHHFNPWHWKMLKTPH